MTEAGHTKMYALLGFIYMKSDERKTYKAGKTSLLSQKQSGFL